MNRVRKYLTPSLLKVNPEYIKKLKLLNIIKFGINDSLFSKSTTPKNPYLFILIDIKGHKKYNSYLDIKSGINVFYDVLEYFKNEPCYVTDYPFSTREESLHVLVLKIDDYVFEKFINGEYSKMYNQEFINKFIIKNTNKETENEIYSVLAKSSNGINVLLKSLEEEYGKLKLDTIKHVKEISTEYDIPPYSKKEHLR